MISTGTKTITKIILSDIMFIQAKHLIYLIQGCIKLPIPPLGGNVFKLFGTRGRREGKREEGKGEEGNFDLKKPIKRYYFQKNLNCAGLGRSI